MIPVVIIPLLLVAAVGVTVRPESIVCHPSTDLQYDDVVG
jgi:hypothetical protein